MKRTPARRTHAAQTGRQKDIPDQRTADRPQEIVGDETVGLQRVDPARSSEASIDSREKRGARRGLVASLPFLFLVAFPLVLFVHVLFGQTQSFFVYPDMTGQFYPWYQKLAQAIHHGYLPIWDANVYGGHSFVGEFQSGTFYPLNLLWVAVFGTASGIHAVFLDLLIALHFFLASLGMYLLCRRWGLSATASLAGGLTFAYAGAVAYRAAGQSCIFFGLALLPFAVYFVALHVESGRWRYLVFAGIVLGLQLLAGHVQPFFHTALLMVIYLLVPHKRTRIEFLARLKALPLRVVLVLGAALVTAAPQLYFSVQYLGNAYRWVSAPNPIGPGQKVPYSVYAYQNIISPHDFLNIVSDTKYPVVDGNALYLGLLPLLLVCLLLLFPRLRGATPAFSTYAVFLLGIAGFGAVAALGHYTLVSRVLYDLPLGTQVREPGRYIILFHFAMAALVAIAVHSVAHHEHRLRLRSRIGLALVPVLVASLLVSGYLPAAWNIAPEDTQQALVAIAFLVLMLLLPRPQVSLPLAALLLLAVGIQLNGDTFIPTVQAGSPVEQQYSRNRIIDYLERLYPKYRIIDDGGALPDNIGDVYRVQTKLGHDATIYKPYFDFISKDWSDSSTVNDLLNIRFIVSRQPHKLKLVMNDPATGLKLYERRTYYPRVFFASDVGISGKRIEALHQFDIIHYADLNQTYRIRAPHSEHVILSEVWYPGWRAYVDGKRVPLLRANIAGLGPLLREVDVPQGTHMVDFKYLSV